MPVTTIDQINMSNAINRGDLRTIIYLNNKGIHPDRGSLDFCKRKGYEDVVYWLEVNGYH